MTIGHQFTQALSRTRQRRGKLCYTLFSGCFNVALYYSVIGSKDNNKQVEGEGERHQNGSEQPVSN